MNAISLIALAPLLASITASPTSSLFINHLENVLGTSFDLKLAANSLAEAQQAERLLLNEIDRLSAVLSSYRADSEFSRWLKAPLHEPVTVSDDLFAVLSGFDHWQAKTSGAINTAAEHLSQL